MKGERLLLVFRICCLWLLLGAHEVLADIRAEIVSPLDQEITESVGIEIPIALADPASPSYQELPFFVPNPFAPGEMSECVLKIMPPGGARVRCHFGLDFTYRIVCDANGCRVLDYFGSKVCSIERKGDRTTLNCKISYIIGTIKFNTTIRVENCQIVIESGSGSPPIYIPLWVYGPALLEPWRNGDMPWLPDLPPEECFRAPETQASN
ncbi:MAG: hypothetical protein J0M12_16795 [Deltaproteobacteria bacterium]|nr:hypothetical protein [Deltaproteobacteria bacterium]